MISFAEIEIALLGLLRLARFDAAFAGFFDLSQQGARRSFRLALWLLPVWLFIINLNMDWKEAELTRVVAAQLIGYTLSWVCFPLLLLSIARVLDRGAQIYGAIAIYNWLSVLSTAINLPIEIAGHYGMSDSWSLTLGYGSVFFVLACEFFAFQRILQVSIGMALVLVGVDFIVGRIIIDILVGLAFNEML